MSVHGDGKHQGSDDDSTPVAEVLAVEEISVEQHGGAAKEAGAEVCTTA